MDTTKTITHISLCAGYGGIDIGLSRAIPNLRTIAFSEIEAFACANLVSKMEAGLLDCAPIWTNLKTLPWDGFLSKVDIISGGFPCQPFSCAGKRDGDEDPRHLFPYILDGIRRCRPSIVFLENVEGILTAKLSGDNWRDPAGTPVLLHVIRELERVGYKATAGIFSASEVRAPHQRKRVFIMAYRKCEGLEGLREFSSSLCGTDKGLQLGDGNSREELAHSNSRGTLGSGYKLGDPSEVGQGGANTEEDCNSQSTSRVWPSRPSQPQFAWEPPRVVGNAKLRGSYEWRVHEGWEGGRKADGSTQKRKHSYNEAQPSLGGDPNGATNRMGHAELCESDNADCGAESEHGATELEHSECDGYHNSNQRPNSDGEQGALGEVNEHREAVGASYADQWGQLDDTRSTELNRLPSQQWQEDPASWESSDGDLYTTCDNRTDELRLLGNGVVPATAELAFRTLWAELNQTN